MKRPIDFDASFISIVIIGIDFTISGVERINSACVQAPSSNVAGVEFSHVVFILVVLVGTKYAVHGDRCYEK